MAEHGQLHIIFLPFMGRGHMIPMTDMARLFGSRGVKSTIVTTSGNAAFFADVDDPNLEIQTIKFPAKEAGLPEGCETADSISNPEMFINFFKALILLQHPFETLLQTAQPNCLIADSFFPWANSTAGKFGIPCLSFHGSGYFSQCIISNLLSHQPHKNISSDSEAFSVPGNLPHDIKLMLSELSPYEKGLGPKVFIEFRDEVRKAQRSCYGVIMNSFYELEPSYVDYSENELGFKHWHIGPLPLYFNDQIRERKSSSMGCLRWLDEKDPNSVIYICFGSFSDVSDAQLHEIALALEAFGQNFILVVRKEDSKEWVPNGFEERVEGRGLIIREWVPQMLILNHRAVGGFMTHCGWNSVLEGVIAGVPMVTWPLHAEQFYNEKLVTDVLKIGIQVGATKWVSRLGDQNIIVSSEKILKAMNGVMNGEEAEGMRNMVTELKEMAKRAVSEGGSSSSDLDALIAEIKSFKV